MSVPSSELGPPTPLSSRKRVCPSPGTKRGGGAHSPAVRGWEERSQFRQLEKRPSTLSTLCLHLILNNFVTFLAPPMCIVTPPLIIYISSTPLNFYIHKDKGRLLFKAVHCTEGGPPSTILHLHAFRLRTFLFTVRIF